MILRRHRDDETTTDDINGSRAEYRLLYSWGETALAEDPAFFRPILETAAFQRALDRLGSASCTIDLMRLSGGYFLRVLVALPDANPESLPDEVDA